MEHVQSTYQQGSDPGPSTQAIRASFSDIPITNIVADKDESPYPLRLPKGRIVANDEGYLIAMKAVEDGDETRLRAALATGLQPNALFKVPRTTLLCEAAVRGRPTIVQILIDNGADVNASDANLGGPCRPLFWAARHCNTAVIRLLLDAGADPEEKSLITESALTAVLSFTDKIEDRHLSALDVLLEKAHINLRMREGETLLEQAIQFRNLDLVEILINRGASSYRSLEVAVRHANPRMVGLLLRRGARDQSGDQALLLAISMQKINCVKLLLRRLERPYTSLLQSRVNAVEGATSDEMGPLLRDCGFQPRKRRSDRFRRVRSAPTGALTVPQVSFSANIRDAPTDAGAMRDQRARAGPLPSGEESCPKPVLDMADFANTPDAPVFNDSDQGARNADPVPGAHPATISRVTQISSGDLEAAMSLLESQPLDRPRAQSEEPTSTVSTHAFSSQGEPPPASCGARDLKMAGEQDPASSANADYDSGFWDDLSLTQVEQSASFLGSLRNGS